MPQSPLDYAPKPEWHARWLHRSVISVGLFVVLVLGYRYAPIAWRNLRLFYWQQRCVHFTAPPDKVAFDGNFSANGNPFETFYRIYSPPGSNGRVVFLNEMRSPTGKRFLVAVEVNSPVYTPGIGLSTRSFEPGSPISPPKEIFEWFYPYVQFTAPINFGQIDPADVSHFTIRCGGGMVDGWLHDDGVVALETRQSKSAQ